MTRVLDIERNINKTREKIGKGDKKVAKQFIEESRGSVPKDEQT